MNKSCSNPWCSSQFDVLLEDRELLKKFDVPDPEQCPTCRHLHRGTIKETIHFYHRKSDLSGAELLSVFCPEKPFPVYSNDEWWSDKWDSLKYGRDFDFSKPFFPQFIELYNSVPKMANFMNNCENCDFCASAGNAKNSYYCERVHRSEDMYYCEAVTGYNKNCCDCYRCQRSENLYECFQCFSCNTCSYLLYCSNTYDSHLCVDCDGCNNCLFCSNIRKKSYHIFNKPVSKEEYAEVEKKYLNGSYSGLQEGLKEWKKALNKTIWRDLNNINCENCRGDSLRNCSNCYECYDCLNSEGNRYCWDLTPSEKNISSIDVTGGGIGELLCNCASVGGGNYFLRMCFKIRISRHLTYCTDCIRCEDCFGCSGLNQKSYCIFNKQYTKEDYERTVPKLIEHMKKTNEWGKFFPPTLERFAYNESKSMQYEPLSKEEVLKRGYKWKEPVEEHLDVEKVIPADRLPDSIEDTPDDVLNWAIKCRESNRPYRIIAQELAFYRRFSIPIPRVHPDLRLEGRRKLLNPYKLWKRTCDKCGKEIQTSFSPGKKEIVYCERCYLETVY